MQTDYCSVLVVGKYSAKRAVQEALEKTGLGYMYVTSYCLTSFWGPGLGMLGRAEPPVEVVEVIGEGTAKGVPYICGPSQLATPCFCVSLVESRITRF